MSRRVTIKRPKLADYQREILESPARFTITEASTKSGKTYSHLWWGFEQWHRTDVSETWEVWWAAPIYDQTRIAFARLKGNLRNVPGYTFNDSALTCTNPMGRTFRFKSAEKPDNLYGENVLCWVFDEFTRARPEAFTALRSTITFTQGKGKMIGNFIGNANWGHQLAEAHKSDPEFAYFKINAQMAVNAGIFPQEELDQARKDLAHSVFMALYMAEGSAHPLQLMRADAINDLWTNEVDEGTRYIVADIARFGRDRTIVGMWSGLRLTDIVQYPQQDLTITASAIDNLARQEKVMRSHVIVDEGGVGGGVVDLLRGCIAFNGASKAIEQAGKEQNFGNMRAQCFYTLADHVNEGLISIADECSSFRDHIAIELEAVRRLEDQAEGKLKVVKKEEMKELLGRSPDLADMMMMRMLPELRGVGTLVNTSIKRKVDRWRKRDLMDQVKSSWR